MLTIWNKDGSWLYIKTREYVSVKTWKEKTETRFSRPFKGLTSFRKEKQIKCRFDFFKTAVYSFIF